MGTLRAMALPLWGMPGGKVHIGSVLTLSLGGVL